MMLKRKTKSKPTNTKEIKIRVFHLFIKSLDPLITSNSIFLIFISVLLEKIPHLVLKLNLIEFHDFISVS